MRPDMASFAGKSNNWKKTEKLLQTIPGDLEKTGLRIILDSCAWKHSSGYQGSSGKHMAFPGAARFDPEYRTSLLLRDNLINMRFLFLRRPGGALMERIRETVSYETCLHFLPSQSSPCSIQMPMVYDARSLGLFAVMADATAPFRR